MGCTLLSLLPGRTRFQIPAGLKAQGGFAFTDITTVQAKGNLGGVNKCAGLLTFYEQFVNYS